MGDNHRSTAARSWAALDPRAPKVGTRVRGNNGRDYVVTAVELDVWLAERGGGSMWHRVTVDEYFRDFFERQMRLPEIA